MLCVEAFGAGADFVMMGGMLAGHDQSGGEVKETNGKKVIQTIIKKSNGIKKMSK